MRSSPGRTVRLKVGRRGEAEFSFELEEAAEGTLLTVVESGFDGIPLARRLEAYRGNDQGWAIQMKAIERYVGEAV